jgi:predicted GNAT family acetyltransferase
MGWNFTDDVETFAEQARPLLARDPVLNTVPLTVLDSVRDGRMGERPSPDPLLFGWYQQSDQAVVSGAVLMTPPYELILAEIPAGGTAELVAALRERGARLPGVNGDVEVVEAFSAAWLDGTSQRAETLFRMRLYRLGELRTPSPMPRGRARLAVESDVDLAIEWFLAFHQEVGAHEGDVAPAVHDRISDRRMWLWEDESHEVVSLAARQRTTIGVARIGPVYTPPHQRRRGFAAAVTAACTADALEEADQLVLFTDLANPTSNSIYQQIGYRPVSDRIVVRYVD